MVWGNCMVYIKRVKLKTITISVIVSSLILLTYQIMISYKINDSGIQDQPKTSNLKIISSTKHPLDHNNSIPVLQKNVTFRGVLQNDRKYVPDKKGKIFCYLDAVHIDVTEVNDDYCDCPSDGMDEPGTNACQNGKFYCEYQPKTKEHPKSVPSSRVNDGICDCCDGSDEWAGVVLSNRLPDYIQKSLGRFQTPCSNHC